MSAIFGERLTFGQEQGPNVQLLVFGDESYARYETLDGYSVVYDDARGVFCYALLREGRFASSGVPVSEPPPPDLPRHLQELETVRHDKFVKRERTRRPRTRGTALTRTLGENQGLLTGRRVSEGTVRGLTVLVNFQDVQSTVTRADVDAMLNADTYTANGNFCSVREYFRRMSSGKLDYTNVVVGPYLLSQKRSFYIKKLLVEEALDLALRDGVDLAQFDSRGEGIVDAVSFMYAGQTQYLDELWPHNAYLSLRRRGLRTGFYMLTSLGRNSADLSIGTFCHENGHMLCRFPDMYDYGNRDGDGVESAGIGMYCLMGAGNHLNRGRTPSPVCAYLRDLVGWCSNEVDLGQDRRHTARHGDYDTVLKFTHPNRSNEYFIVENRSKLALDQFLPSSGLGVFHCDTQGSNEWQEGTATKHFQCALLQADGHLDLERNLNQGDGGDLYGALSGVALTHGTLPSSVWWDGAESGLVLSALDAPGDTIQFTTGVAPAPAVPAGPIRAEATPGLRIPDRDPAGVSSTLAVDAPGTVREIRVTVDITHTYIGDLRVELISPAGRRVLLHGQLGGAQDNLVMTYDSAPPSGLASLVGQPVKGTWLLRAADVVRQDVGTLNRWAIEITPDS
jgi:M6 family metalloprotease-like protein